MCFGHTFGHAFGHAFGHTFDHTSKSDLALLPAAGGVVGAVLGGCPVLFNHDTLTH